MIARFFFVFLLLVGFVVFLTYLAKNYNKVENKVFVDNLERKVHINNKNGDVSKNSPLEFPFPCVGYQHSLPGDNPNANDIYSRWGRMNIIDQDMNILKKMGVRVIRLWGFKDISGDYGAFLDRVWSHGIYVLPAFPLNPNVFPDLRSNYARKLIVHKFKGFIQKHMRHPAVLFWIVGNEPNMPPPSGYEQMDAFINMVDELNDKKNKWEKEHNIDHPLCVPFADTATIGDIFSTYGNITSKWGLNCMNVYRVNTLPDYFASIPDNVTMLLTEIGSDVWDNTNSRIDNNMQANYEKTQWNYIKNTTASIVGSCFMEYSDELWKGNVADSTNTLVCPDILNNVHAPCGISGYGDFDDNHLSEEYFGLVTSFVQSGYFCVKPRTSLFELAKLFNIAKGNTNFNSKSLDHTSCVFILDITPIIIFVVVLVLGIIAYFFYIRHERLLLVSKYNKILVFEQDNLEKKSKKEKKDKKEKEEKDLKDKKEKEKKEKEEKSDSKKDTIDDKTISELLDLDVIFHLDGSSNNIDVSKIKNVNEMQCIKIVKSNATTNATEADALFSVFRLHYLNALKIVDAMVLQESWLSGYDNCFENEILNKHKLDSDLLCLCRFRVWKLLLDQYLHFCSEKNFAPKGFYDSNTKKHEYENYLSFNEGILYRCHAALWIAIRNSSEIVFHCPQRLAHLFYVFVDVEVANNSNTVTFDLVGFFKAIDADVADVIEGNINLDDLNDYPAMVNVDRIQTAPRPLETSKIISYFKLPKSFGVFFFIARDTMPIFRQKIWVFLFIAWATQKLKMEELLSVCFIFSEAALILIFEIIFDLRVLTWRNAFSFGSEWKKYLKFGKDSDDNSATASSSLKIVFVISNAVMCLFSFVTAFVGFGSQSIDKLPYKTLLFFTIGVRFLIVSVSTVYRTWKFSFTKENTKKNAWKLFDMLLARIAYWLAVLLLTAVFEVYLILPTLKNLTYAQACDMAVGVSNNLYQPQLLCWVTLASAWMLLFFTFMVTNQAAFVLMLSIVGYFQGLKRGLGNVQSTAMISFTWDEIENHLQKIIGLHHSKEKVQKMLGNIAKLNRGSHVPTSIAAQAVAKSEMATPEEFITHADLIRTFLEVFDMQASSVFSTVVNLGWLPKINNNNNNSSSSSSNNVHVFTFNSNIAYFVKETSFPPALEGESEKKITCLKCAAEVSTFNAAYNDANSGVCTQCFKCVRRDSVLRILHEESQFALVPPAYSQFAASTRTAMRMHLKTCIYVGNRSGIIFLSTSPLLIRLQNIPSQEKNINAANIKIDTKWNAGVLEELIINFASGFVSPQEIVDEIMKHDDLSGKLFVNITEAPSKINEIGEVKLSQQPDFSLLPTFNQLKNDDLRNIGSQFTNYFIREIAKYDSNAIDSNLNNNNNDSNTNNNNNISKQPADLSQRILKIEEDVAVTLASIGTSTDTKETEHLRERENKLRDEKNNLLILLSAGIKLNNNDGDVTSNEIANACFLLLKKLRTAKVFVDDSKFLDWMDANDFHTNVSEQTKIKNIFVSFKKLFSEKKCLKDDKIGESLITIMMSLLAYKSKNNNNNNSNKNIVIAANTARLFDFCSKLRNKSDKINDVEHNFQNAAMKILIDGLLGLCKIGEYSKDFIVQASDDSNYSYAPPKVVVNAKSSFAAGIGLSDNNSNNNSSGNNNNSNNDNDNNKPDLKEVSRDYLQGFLPQDIRLACNDSNKYLLSDKTGELWEAYVRRCVVQVWQEIVYDMWKSDRISMKERDKLRARYDGEYNISLESEDATNSLSFLISTLRCIEQSRKDKKESSLLHEEKDDNSMLDVFCRCFQFNNETPKVTTNSVEPHPFSLRLRQSLTTMIPCYAETIINEIDELRKTTQEGTGVTSIEGLAYMYQYEFKCFCERLLKLNIVTEKKPNLIIQAFSSGKYENICNESMKDLFNMEMRLWASNHGQTLARTVRGAANYGDALSLLSRIQGFKEFKKSRYYQLLVLHQTFQGLDEKFKSDLNFLTEAYDIEIVSEYVSDVEEKKREAQIEQNNQYLRMKSQENVDNAGIGNNSSGIDFSRWKYWTVKREWNPKTLKSEITGCLPRKFPLRIMIKNGDFTQGKSGNQRLGQMFVRGQILQAIDVNQDGTFGEALKFNYLMQSIAKYRSDGKEPEVDTENKHKKKFIFGTFRKRHAKHTIVGFREWIITSNEGAVGRFMAYAEFTFGTIFQRVLSNPLGVRLHYGHPDLFDAYWTRSRGLLSKASPNVNLNEDIFAAYEGVLQRQSVTHMEIVEMGKGRETNFLGALAFDAKLAMGAIAQYRSRDVYEINARLDSIRQFTLFYGSLGFFLVSYLVAASIKLYVITYVLFSLSSVTLTDLGLLRTNLSGEWMFHIGLIMIVPLMVEKILEKGLKGGLLSVLLDFPLSSLFFVFHLQTKAFHMAQTFMTGKADYVATGRKFATSRHSLLDAYKNCVDSHYFPAVKLFVLLMIYYSEGHSLPGGNLPMYTIWFSIFAWIFAPIVFNPFPTTSDYNRDIMEAWHWFSTPYVSGQLLDPDNSNPLMKIDDGAKASFVNYYIDKKAKYLEICDDNNILYSELLYNIAGCFLFVLFLTVCLPPAALGVFLAFIMAWFFTFLVYVLAHLKTFDRISAFILGKCTAWGIIKEKRSLDNVAMAANINVDNNNPNINGINNNNNNVNINGENKKKQHPQKKYKANSVMNFVKRSFAVVLPFAVSFIYLFAFRPSASPFTGLTFFGLLITSMTMSFLQDAVLTLLYISFCLSKTEKMMDGNAPSPSPSSFAWFSKIFKRNNNNNNNNIPLQNNGIGVNAVDENRSLQLYGSTVYHYKSRYQLKDGVDEEDLKKHIQKMKDIRKVFVRDLFSRGDWFFPGQAGSFVFSMAVLAIQAAFGYFLSLFSSLHTHLILSGDLSRRLAEGPNCSLMLSTDALTNNKSIVFHNVDEEDEEYYAQKEIERNQLRQRRKTINKNNADASQYQAFVD